MNTFRNHARLIGILYIIGTIAGISSVALTDAAFGADDYLVQIAADDQQVLFGALAVLTMGLALAMIPAIAWPVLKQHSEPLAMGYVIFRGALETTTYLISITAWLLLVVLARESVDAGDNPADYFETFGFVLKDASDWIGYLGTVVFIGGALMFYTVLYQTKLVPRWLSGWGLLAAIPYVLSSLLAMFGTIESLSSEHVMAQAPLGLQEMVLALWLIIRGFNPAATIFRK